MESDDAAGATTGDEEPVESCGAETLPRNAYCKNPAAVLRHSRECLPHTSYSATGTRFRAFLMVPRSVMILSCSSVIA